SSGYNVLMVGGVGDAPPTRVILSAAGPTGPSNTQPGTSGQKSNQSADEENEAVEPQPEDQQPPPEPMPPPQETQQPTPIRNPFGDTPRVPMPPMNQPTMP